MQSFSKLIFQTRCWRFWLDSNPDHAWTECWTLQRPHPGEHQQQLSFKAHLPGFWEQRFSRFYFLKGVLRPCPYQWSSFLGQEESYLRKIYQLFTSLQFQTSGGLNGNKLTVSLSPVSSLAYLFICQEENSTCSSKYLECEMSLISSLQKLQGERNNF